MTHFANNIRTCERSQSSRYPIFWMSMFWMSWLSLSRWHVTQSWSSIHSILTSLQEAAPRPQQTSLQPHNLEKHAQSSVLAGLATRGLLTHNAHSGSNTDVELFIPSRGWVVHHDIFFQSTLQRQVRMLHLLFIGGAGRNPNCC